MTLARWDPFRELVSIQDRINRVFSGENWPFRGSGEALGAWNPAVEIFERGDSLVLRAELPGVSKEDIDVHVEEGNLVLRGQRKRDQEIDEANAYRLERAYGSFTRSFSLPTSVDASSITATYKDGVLEVVLPKAEEAKPKRVEIVSE